MDTATPKPFVFSRTTLRAAQGRADAPLLLDVRRESAHQASPRMLAGAIRVAPEEVAQFARTQTRRPTVVYCVYGHNVSEEATQTLRAAGWQAWQLAGGIEGGETGVDTPEDIAQWRTQPLLTVTKRNDWGVGSAQASRWITRARPKIDRIACPWLVLRFIDPRAQFHYVPTEQVLTQAKALPALAYDLPGAPLTHVGAACSFDAVLSAFELHDPALDKLALIVRGADSNDLALAPQSAGLAALSLGLSALHQDDHAMLAAALPLYDALYAWCQAQLGADVEVHRWTPQTLATVAVS